MREYKLVVLGAGGVGKSSLTVQYVQGVYMDSYDPTIEDSYRKNTSIDNRPCSLEILDTAGVEQFTAMRELYIKNGEGFILVYSVTSEDSLQELKELREQIIRIKDNPNIPMVLVANKCDLEQERQVSPQQGVSVAESWGKTPFYETSAKYRSNVDEIFIDSVRQIMRRDSAFSPFMSRGQGSLDENSKQILASISAANPYDDDEEHQQDPKNPYMHSHSNSTSKHHHRHKSSVHSHASSLTIHHTLPAQKSRKLRTSRTRTGSLNKNKIKAKEDKDCIIM